MLRFYSDRLATVVRVPLVRARSHALGYPRESKSLVRAAVRLWLRVMIAVTACATLGPCAALYAQSFNFGNVPVGTTSAPQVFPVTNLSSNVVIQIGSVGIIGDSNDFRVQEQGNCPIIPFNGTCRFIVTFKPTVLGLRTATLNIQVLEGSSQQVGLQGFGVPAGPPPPPPLPAVSLSPPSVTFPNKQVVGSSSALQTIVVKNVGNASLHVSEVGVTGPNAADFAPPKSTCGVVAPGGTCGVMVKFTPAGTATRSATLLIPDDAGGSPQSVPLSGIGVASCDVNSDGFVNVVDVQLLVDQVLGIFPATGDINGDGSVNVADLQLVVNAALGGGCNH
jgi:hypothetical protein